MQRRVKVERDPELKIEITQLNEANPDWSGKNIHDALQKNPKFKDRVPSIRKIQDVVKKNAERKARLKEQAKTEGHSLDAPWHMSNLRNDKYYVPADAIPIILEIQKKIDKNITVRTVNWLTRLYKVLKTDECLYFWSLMYAEREKVYELAGILRFESSEMDAKLLDGNFFSMPIINLFFNMFYQWLIRNENLLSKEQKERIGEMLIRQIEEAFNTLAASGWEKGEEWQKGVPPDIWLFYASSIIKRAGESGYFGEHCLDEIKAFLVKLGDKFPNNLHMLPPMDSKSWKNF